MDSFKIVCPCHFGLESVLKFEISKIGGKNITVNDGRVSFEGDFSMVARANYCLATAERVLIELLQFRADTFDDLLYAMRTFPLEEFVGKHDAFPVKGYSLNSKLKSVPACQRTIKKGAVDRLCEKYGVSYLEESGATVQIQFSIMNDVCTIYLDTSGQGLHKRGYRKVSNLAPIKETLASGIVDLARVRPNSVVCDPFCGSGTILIEAGLKALNIAPGINRHFAAERWQISNPSVWKDERTRAIDLVDKSSTFEAYGYDIDPESVELSLNNVAKVGIKSKVHVMQGDVANFTPIRDSITICNPPYGERLLEIRQAEELYTTMGERFGKGGSNPSYIISPHEDFEKFFGKKADKRRKLYNGMIKCQLFMYFK